MLEIQFQPSCPPAHSQVVEVPHGAQVFAAGGHIVTDTA